MDINLKELTGYSISKLNSMLEDGYENGFEYPYTQELIEAAIQLKMAQ